MTTKKFCKCGKRISQSRAINHLPCDACLKKDMDAIHEIAKGIVELGKCPNCGSKLVHNLALPGWWQCAQYGNWKLTKGDPNKPDCGFQIFTE